MSPRECAAGCVNKTCQMPLACLHYRRSVYRAAANALYVDTPQLVHAAERYIAALERALDRFLPTWPGVPTQ